ncbi:MAG: alpha-galactosidase [Ruminococcaceae bacterium]|nr:alpha-galactosidase [Oscillospiraceae bacterium]
MANQIFLIETKNTHYVMGVNEKGILRHLHWGKKAPLDDYHISPEWERNSNHSELDYISEEYSPFGGTRYRSCAFKCEYFDKCRDTVLTFSDASQDNGKLDVTLTDEAYGIKVVLHYRWSAEHDIITRSVTVINESQHTLKIEKLMSAELTLPTEQIYDITNTNGSWAGEFQLETSPFKAGSIRFETHRGTAGHVNSPFLILSKNATEDFGDVYFATLGWGGNFKMEAQRDFIGITRVTLGLNDFDFSMLLGAGESVTTPKAYIGYTNGFAEMSNQMNDFAINNILPKNFADKPLPVLYNSWEATGFDVNVENQLRLAKIAAEIGCELFVMDDGWFGQRKDDWAGLGDWYVNSEKFPNGIDELIDGVNKLGMDFGLWFEPEMVNADSDLYREHPEWVYHYDTRKPSLLRHQLVLNLTMPEVKQYVFDVMDKMVASHNIKYIKWDMNRPFSEIGAPNLENQRDLWYLHTLAVYDIADRLKEKYPYLQIEACSSGGGRAEYGALEHFDMAWTSDNTDPVDRLEIQRGFSMLYPRKSMRAWVTDWNSGSRPTSLDFRFNVSMQGSLSIGSNLLRYTDEDIEKCKHYIALYKEIRELVQFGKLYRLKNYRSDGMYANQYVSHDKTKSVLFICSTATSFFNRQFKTLNLKGLDETATYKIKTPDGEVLRSGAYLMNVPLTMRLSDPLQSVIWQIEKV